MRVSIKQSEGINFVAKTDKATFEVKPEEISPIELFAVSIISCSGTDIVSIPKAQGFEVSDIKIDADVTRAQDVPKVFEHIHISYSFNSNGDDESARRWVQSSLETYCSTINTVRNVSRITYSIIHNTKEIVKINEINSGEHIDDFGDIGVCCSS